MTTPARCPRCGGSLQPPGLMSSDWRCAEHGPVLPYVAAPRPSAEGLALLAAQAAVPVWAPLPLLPGWMLTGSARAGDERSGTRATAVALAGPSPLGGPADLVLVAEEPGTGLGAHVAGLSADPAGVGTGSPDDKVLAAGRPTALWRCDSADDRVAFVGEASGVWLWCVLWPPSAELLLLEHLELHDLRHEAHAAELMPTGAPTTRLP